MDFFGVYLLYHAKNHWLGWGWAWTHAHAPGITNLFSEVENSENGMV